MEVFIFLSNHWESRFLEVFKAENFSQTFFSEQVFFTEYQRMFCIGIAFKVNIKEWNKVVTFFE